MRRFHAWAVVCAALLMLLTACSSEKQVELYKMLDFSGADEASIKLLTDSEEVSVFETAVRKAKRQPGIVDMASPEYGFKLGEREYFLWIGEDVGTIMNAEDTHTIYSLPAKNARAVSEVVGRYFESEK